MSTPKKPTEIEVGYVGLGDGPDRIEKRTVDPEEGDAPPWDVRTKYSVVGSDLDRVDGLAKASGRAKYAYDVTFPGLQQAMILRAPIAKGVLTALELDEAAKMPGISAVVALKETGNKIRFVGDALAAVAGANLDVVRDAIEKIRTAYEQEDHIVDYLQSPSAPLLIDGKIDEDWAADADIDKALAAAAATHVATYRTEVQTHSSLETHGGTAKWSGPDLEVWLSTQATFGCRGELTQALQRKGIVANVTIHAEYVGGGFGSKFTAGVEGLAVALLSHAAQAPVKLMLDRFEEHTCTGNRPAALMQVRGAVDAAGKISAWDWRSFGGTGFNGGGGRVSTPNSYTTQIKGRQTHKDIAADTDPARPMRAPGYPQGYFGAELFVDELATKAGIDPLEFRLTNDIDQMRQDQWRFGAERFGWTAARAHQNEPNQRHRRGVGLASARWGGLGSHGRGTPHGAFCRIDQNGIVESRSGAQDVGPGLKTVMAILTAEELGIDSKHVRATSGHTTDPSGPASGGSTTTPSMAPVIRNAAFLAKQQLCAIVARHLGVPAAEVSCENGVVGTATATLGFAEACKLIGPNPIEAHGRRYANWRGKEFHAGVCGCQFAEVEVDTWTGVVRVIRMLGVQDCGVVIAKKLAESQVLGAMIQGLSYALHEQRLMDPRSGRMLNGDFLRYKIAGPRELPDLDVVMMSVANGHTNVGAAGLGEPPSVAAPAAVANAVFHALGVPLRHLPITPDKVLAALANKD